MTPDEKTKLLAALKKAKETGLKVSQATPDEGTCNLDCPTLTIERLRATDIHALCKEAGLTCFKWDVMKSWVICGCAVGQAEARSQGAKAASQVLKDAGYTSGMYYQMD